MEKKVVKRGEVIWVELQGEGSVQKGLRPAIVISNDIGNKFSPVVTVIPMTTYQGKKRMLPTHTLIKEEELGYEFKDSIALAEQMRVVDKNSIYSICKRLSENTMSKIENSILISLSIEK